jgi:hypothetical protein
MAGVGASVTTYASSIEAVVHCGQDLMSKRCALDVGLIATGIGIGVRASRGKSEFAKEAASAIWDWLTTGV